MAALFLVLVPTGGAADPAAPASSPVRRVNVPDLRGEAFAPAILWLGKVEMTSNYADVRIWHYGEQLTVVVHIMDRLLWHDPSPGPSDLDKWDAVSLYIDLAGNVGSAPGPTSYRFVKQLWNADSSSSKAVYRGNGGAWALATVPFTASDGWRGNYPNDGVWDDGWVAEFQIPFASLGFSGSPPPTTVWGFGISVHDRDDAAGTAIPDQVWPEGFQALSPAAWGQLRFGRPAYVPPTTRVDGTTLVQHGLAGAQVPDAAVGGHTICGGSMNAWTEWGTANYAGYTQFNIQNQWDISDFMCFSKYYVTFPLSAVPPGAQVVSARVTLSFFGNAGYSPDDAQPSAINVLTVAEDWTEGNLTWNNAPYALENTSVTWVYPVGGTHSAGPYDWDVSYAAAQALERGEPLRLAFYSTDGEYHSGKYFWTSDSDDWGGTVRPALEVEWALQSPRVDPLDGPLQVGATNTLSGSGFSPGAVVKLFVASADGPQAFGPFSPSNRTQTSLTWSIPSSVPLGNGFGSVQVVNTDANYAVSNVVGALLEGDPQDNLPTIRFVDGLALAPADPAIALAHVDTVVQPGATVTVVGTGFKNPLVNLFTATGNLGPLVPLAGGSSTQVQTVVPLGAPTGPGNLQVVNSPYSGNVASNAVAVVIGARVTVTGVSVAGKTVTVSGTGFSPLSVINLFNKQGAGAVNLGGLSGASSKIPLTLVSDRLLTFTIPAGAVAGPAFVEVLNPPYIPFSSSGTASSGAFTVP